MAEKPSPRIARNAGKLGQAEVWLGSAEDVKFEIQNISQKIKEMRGKHRALSNHESLDDAKKLLSEWNEEMLLFCKANRRKYTSGDTQSMKLDKKLLELESMVMHYQDMEKKLQKDLTEAIKEKENALNRLSEIQSRLLKLNNPDITDLSDENRPTNLGTKFKQLYEDEWTDAFEFLTEKRTPECLKEEDAIKMLYTMLKKCNEVCVEALEKQHTCLAEVVCDPTYIKFQDEVLLQGQQSKPMKPSANEAKLDLRAQPAHQMNSNVQQVSFASTLPARGGNVLAHAKQYQQNLGKSHMNKNQQPGTKSSAPVTSGNKDPPLAWQNSGDRKPAMAKKPSGMSDFYDAQQTAGPTKPPEEEQMKARKLQTPIREFSKTVASQLLANVKISDILPAIKKTGDFPDDVLQDTNIQIYLEKCFHLCWLMLVQYPSMHMDLETKPGTKFDANLFDYYTHRGPTITLVVWPPVYLHKDGPVVCKGYADCKK